MDIPGIPDSIPRARVLESIQTLGLDPKQVLGLRMEIHAVHVEVCALDDQGRHYSDDDENLATHQIAIPIVDTPPAEPAAAEPPEWRPHHKREARRGAVTFASAPQVKVGAPVIKAGDPRVVGEELAVALDRTIRPPDEHQDGGGAPEPRPGEPDKPDDH